MRIIHLDKTQSNLVLELFDKYRVFYKQSSDIMLAKNFIEERLNNDESIIFVALDGDKPIGFTQLYPNYSSVQATKNWTLNDLYVEQEYRKQGVGKKLIEAAMKFAKENNAAFLELSTATDNHAAQNLYEQIGFIRQQADTEFYTYRVTLK